MSQTTTSPPLQAEPTLNQINASPRAPNMPHPRLCRTRNGQIQNGRKRQTPVSKTALPKGLLDDPDPAARETRQMAPTWPLQIGPSGPLVISDHAAHRSYRTMRSTGHNPTTPPTGHIGPCGPPGRAAPPVIENRRRKKGKRIPLSPTIAFSRPFVKCQELQGGPGGRHPGTCGRTIRGRH